jgi:hypothetical protein
VCGRRDKLVVRSALKDVEDSFDDAISRLRKNR